MKRRDCENLPFYILDALKDCVKISKAIYKINVNFKMIRIIFLSRPLLIVKLLIFFSFVIFLI